MSGEAGKLNLNVDVIIPVYRPDRSFFRLIEKLEAQTVPIRHIIIMNTEEKYFEQLIYGTRFLEQHRQVTVHHLSKKEFDHGRTRARGVRKSDAEVFVMMTQDAMPADNRLIEALLAALAGERVAAAYARQLPAADAGPVETYMRSYNYPENSRIKSAEDLPQLGIKTYFCSNVCCAYRRDVYEELGGFVRHAIFNEDMIYAAGAIKAGYRIAYAADARVIHSHNYSCGQQFHRNFDLGVSQADHPEIFAGVPSEGEGIRSVKAAAAYLREQKQKRRLPGLFLQSGCKYAGYWLGKHYRKLPAGLVLRCTMNREYWDQEGRRRDVAKIDAARGYGKSEEETR
ncbi:MAG: glycosyltransferase [Lachnospiraceae bacterium]|nr:glycosyltransferase [Lachnospiraceae bacterium]